MIIGSWFHNDDGALDVAHLKAARDVGISSARCYDFHHAAPIRDILLEQGMSIHAGVWLEPEIVLENPKAQVKTHVLQNYLDLQVPIVAFCIGNEVRDPWTEIGKWTLSEKLAANLALVIGETKEWLQDRDIRIPVTYAIEGPFPWRDCLSPVIDACDVISINAFPMQAEHWFGDDSFAANAHFLTDQNSRQAQLSRFEESLYQVVDRLGSSGKQIILSETGVASGIGFSRDTGAGMPSHNAAAFEETYQELTAAIKRVATKHQESILGAYLYEWRDNYHHSKAMLENSPIHSCFGLCYRDGQPKFNLGFIEEELILQR